MKAREVINWKSSLQTWLVDAAIIMVGAWIFLVIGQIILTIMVSFLR